MALLKKILPKSFLWRLSLLNFLVIMAAIIVSGWAIYHTACFLVEGMGDLSDPKQNLFNRTLYQYLWVFSLIGIIGGTLLHYYLMKRLIKPLRQLIQSMKRMEKGDYPEAITVASADEVGELIGQFNALISQLHHNEAERGKLITDISHEVRTPLANMNGYLHALQAGDIDGDQDLFRSLHQEAVRLTAMIDQMEQLKEWDHVSRQPVAQKQIEDIQDLLSQSMHMFARTLEEEDIPLEMQAEKMPLSIHKEGIQQVISNLLDNAIRYYQGSGAILVQGEHIKEGYRVSVSGPSESISNEAEQRIFDRFYRVDASRSRQTGGTGLGLAIAREIIENHGGTIDVEAGEAYNTFFFILPTE